MAAPIRRTLPPRADLAQQKTQARELLQSFNRNDADAVARVRGVLPDKPRIVLADAQFVLAREYGFHDWAALRQHIDDRTAATRAPHERLHHAMQRRESPLVRELLTKHAEFRPLINAPLFAFNAPALVAFADDADMVEVLLEFGADPNQRSGWWAGGFHPLHVATGLAAERLRAAGAIPDTCAAAHLDDLPLLRSLLTATPSSVKERGGDGQTPLHFARSREAVDLLLDAGADIDARDVDHDSTPAQWMLARRRGADRWALASHLADRGASCDVFLAAALGRTDDMLALLRADPTLLDAQVGRGQWSERPPASAHIYTWTIGAQRTPLDVAAQFSSDATLAAMLPFATVMQRFQLACRTADASTARALVADNPGLMASLDVTQRRAITDAAWQGDAAAVTVMLELGFDPATPGHDSGTALHCAAWQGSAATVAALLQSPDAPTLLSLLDARYRNTPLGWCCHGSLNGPRGGAHADVARLLLDAGAALEMNDAADDVESVLSEYNGTESRNPSP